MKSRVYHVSRFYYSFLLTCLTVCIFFIPQSTPAFEIGFTPHLVEDDVISVEVTGGGYRAEDIDQDNDLDIFLVSNREYFFWYKNDGQNQPSFSREIICSTTKGAPRCYDIEDLDKDGDKDIVFGDFSNDVGSIEWCENKGGTEITFSVHSIARDVSGPRAIKVVDLDGDDDFDIVAGMGLESSIWWYENDGNIPPSFTMKLLVTNFNSINSLAIADFDKDGDPDIGFNANWDNVVGWCENKGGQPLIMETHIVDNELDLPVAIHSADINGDEYPDLVSVSAGDNKVFWYENSGTSQISFTRRQISPDPDSGQSVVREPDLVYTQDLEGDGDLDIFVGGKNSVWFENEGFSQPGFQPHIISDLRTNAIFVADMNGDSLLDVLTGAYNVGTYWHEQSYEGLIALTTDLESNYTANSSVVVNGVMSATEYASTVLVNDITQSVDIAGNFSTEIDLNEGENLIVGQAYRESGILLDEEQITVIRDTIPPELAIQYPVQGQVLESTAIEVVGTATDSAPVTIWIQVPLIGYHSSLDQDNPGLFSESFNVQEGNLTIEIYVEDVAGNRSETVSIPVTIDTSLDFGSPAVLNTDAGEDTRNDSEPWIATDHQGHWAVVWKSDAQQILFSRSMDNGSSWSAPTSWNAESDETIFIPQVALGREGVWIVIWNTTSPITYKTYKTQSTDYGVSWSSPEALRAKIEMGSVWRALLGTDWQGNWNITSPLKGWNSVDNGQSWTLTESITTKRVFDPSWSGSEGWYSGSMGVDHAGNWLYSWPAFTHYVHYGTEWAVQWDTWRLYMASATYPFSGWNAVQEFDINSYVEQQDVDEGLFIAPEEGEISLAGDGQGTWLAVWQSKDCLQKTLGSRWGGNMEVAENILLSRSSDYGVSWTYPAALNEDATTEWTVQDLYPQIVTDLAGTWICLWKRESEIRAAMSTDNGLSWGLQNRPEVFSNAELPPKVVSASDGTIIAVWNSTDSVGGAVGLDNDIFYSIRPGSINQNTPTPTFTPSLTPTFTPNETSFTPTPTYYPGDLNQDRDVDTGDLLDFIRGLNSGTGAADLNGDEASDSKDLFYFSQWWQWTQEE